MAHLLQMNALKRETLQTWNPEQVLAEALAERAAFLKRYPELQALQDEIDDMLEKAGSTENRMKVLAMLMEAKLIELNGELRDLNRILLSIKEEQELTE